MLIGHNLKSSGNPRWTPTQDRINIEISWKIYIKMKNKKIHKYITAHFPGYDKFCVTTITNSMRIVQNDCFLRESVVRLAICDCWHFVHMWKTLA
jgi:hypothetical protein